MGKIMGAETSLLLWLPLAALAVEMAAAAPDRETFELQRARLFFTAEQREAIDRQSNSSPGESILAQSRSDLPRGVAAVRNSPVAPVRVDPKPPVLNGYLIAPTRPVVWLGGVALVQHGELGQNRLRALSIDDGLVFLRFDHAQHWLQLGAQSTGNSDSSGDFLLQVRP